MKKTTVHTFNDYCKCGRLGVGIKDDAGNILVSPWCWQCYDSSKVQAVAGSMIPETRKA